MSHQKKQARQKAATAIREIIKAAHDLTTAEGVLLENSRQPKEPTKQQTIMGGKR